MTDNIKLGKKIDQGYQAEIFKAKYGRTGVDEVVVKRFLDSTHKSTKQEVAIIQRLTHKNIVQFYHVHHDMVVMEYVEGGNLSEAIVGKALKSWEVKTQIAKDISLGLAYLHSLGIIHCDIKSPNILLTEHKEAKICDFGLAVKVGESGGGGGTLQWMAPELLQNPPQYTSKSDVYALGMVMWEMASESTQPYREHTPDGMMYCIMHGILEEYPDTTPNTFAAGIQMCWMLDPYKRPAAMEVLPDIAQSSHRQDIPEHQQKIPDNIGKMDHYLKALTKTFKTDGSKGFREILKNSMLRDIKTMDWFESSAIGNGSAEAMFKMGNMYYSGTGGVQLNYGEALEWYLAASEAGIAVAMLKVSQMYEYGHGVDQDVEEARLWYYRGEEAVNEQGRLNNRIVHHGAGVSEHHARTMDWFSQNANGEIASTYCQIGDLYYYGGDLVRDNSKAMEWYLRAGDDGDFTAMTNIGVMYETGQGAEQDYSKAMEWYLKASVDGDGTAMFFMGNMYEHGEGVEQDHGKAMECYLKASDAGDETAMRSIGVFYEHGRGVEQDYKKAMEWYLKASEAGDITTMLHIGHMYHDGQGVGQDYGKSLEWYLRASNAGDETAMVFIGAMYENGQGVEQDYSKAVEWYLKASDAGDTTAMRFVGDMYEHGEGVEQDDSQAMKWYLKASDAGDTIAMRCVGAMYDCGCGVEQDYSKAVECYLRASDGGDTAAMNSLGAMYECGQGVEQDYDKAAEWFLKASDGGDTDAMNNLGVMYENGQGVEQDYDKAMEWYSTASDGGTAVAMLNIGDLYRDGRGVVIDHGRAIEWYTKACDAGDPTAGARLQEILSIYF
ncbi:hypothetical protein BGZ68_003712 [Mortierella alpina]|nr:hypothetical protein BGZ68_003712 [Mortierella alpina]